MSIATSVARNPLGSADTISRPASIALAGAAGAGDAVRPASLPSNSLLALRGISLSFGGVRAVSDIDLDVAEGEIRAVIGPNGAGKSSLINIISGIYRPDKGTVYILGESFRQVPADRVAEIGLARTYQNLALFKGLSVLDNVIAGLSVKTRSNFIEQVFGSARARNEDKAAREAARGVIERLHLTAVADRKVGTLSYGVQKRVELARALIAKPRLLLLDEPMAGMTAGEKTEMATFVRAARDEFGATIVLIEHDIGVVMGLSDHIAVLDYGRKIADGTPDAVQKDQAVIDAYLGVAHEGEEETLKAAVDL